jgi:hypothetical protein
VAAQRWLTFRCGRGGYVDDRRRRCELPLEERGLQDDETRTLDRLMSALPEEHREVLARWLQEVNGAPHAVR